MTEEKHENMYGGREKSNTIKTTYTAVRDK